MTWTVLVFTGGDLRIASRIRAAGYEAVPLTGLPEMVCLIRPDALVIGADVDWADAVRLVEALRRRPKWDPVPIVMVTRLGPDVTPPATNVLVVETVEGVEEVLRYARAGAERPTSGLGWLGASHWTV